MAKKHNFKKPIAAISKVAIIFIFAAVQLFSPFLQNNTYADDTLTKIARYEALKVLTKKCLNARDSIYIKDRITKDEYRDKDAGLMNTDKTLSVSAALFDGDSSLSCSKALFWYYTAAYPGSDAAEKRQAFIRAYYDTSTDCDDDFVLACYSITDSIENKKELLTKDVNAYLDGMSIDNATLNLWRDRIISEAFNNCYKFEAENPTEANPDRKDPKNWVIENKDNKSNAVGWMAEVEITGSYVDGRVGCDEDVKPYIFPDHTDLIGFSGEDLTEELQEQARERAKSTIKPYLTSNPNIILACAAANGLSTSALSVDVIADYLVSGTVGTSIMSILSTSDESKIKAFGECITDNIAEVKSAIEDLNEELGTIEDNVDDATVAQDSDNPKSDDCLANAPEFIGWFACGVIDLIDKFLEQIEDIIKRLLKFSITEPTNEGGVNQNDTLKIAWNVFRSISTVIVMIGFLLALVVKGVKG